MKAMIYCVPTAKGIHTFYLVTAEKQYFLFRQKYRKGVQEYFSNGVSVNQAMDFSRSHNDDAVIRTMTKIPMYIRYIEKEYGIEVFEQTRKHNNRNAHSYNYSCEMRYI